MSRFTVHRVEVTRRLLATRLEEVQGLQRDALVALSGVMPENLDRLARLTGLRQREITRQLGSRGLTELRIDLREAAQELGDELLGAVRSIPWPATANRWSPVRQEEIHAALHEYLAGHRTLRLARILWRHGYSAGRPDAEERQTLVTPAHLTARIDFSRLADGLTRLAGAERDVARAERDDGTDDVTRLWNESTWYRHDEEPTMRAWRGTS